MTVTASCSEGSPPSADATLANLTLSQGTLTPGFTSGTTSYTASVGNAVTSLTVTPTASDANASITVNSVTVASGNASGPIALDVGSNIITVVVTAEDGSTTETYTVDVTRAAPASTDATLAGLTLSQGTLTPGFTSGTTSYTASVGNAVTSLTVTPTASDANASITVNSATVASGNASGPIPLDVGSNIITVEVTAEDGSTTETYTVDVTRTAPAVTITLDPAAGALPTGQVGTAYSQSFTASGGTGPYSYAVTAGALPAGLTLAANGALTGAPTTAGTASFTITATDANSDTGEAAYSLQIDAAPVTITLDPAAGALPAAMAGEDYTVSITASGGTGPYLYSVIAGSLPGGLVLNVSTGELNGPLNVDTEGNYSFTIQASDGYDVTGSAAYTLTVTEQTVVVTDKEVTVPAGSTPPNVNLASGATGGPFESAAIVAVEPPTAGTAQIVHGEFAQVGPGPIGFYLKFTPNPTYSGQVTIRFTLTSSLGTSNVGTVLYTLGYSPVAVAKEIHSLVYGFVQTRQNLISTMIRIPGLRERRQMRTAREVISMRMKPSSHGMTLGFATSLAQMSAASDAIERSLGVDTSVFNVWVDGSFAVHNRKQNDNRWGTFALFSAGADYLVTENALIGFSFHYDRMSDPTRDNSRLSGDGWLVGPYASFELGRGVFWDTSLLYGGSSNDIDTTFWDGRFNTRRWMFDTALSGQWYLDETTTLSPKLRAVYLSEKVDDYRVTNAAGDIVGLDGFTVEQLRVSLGAELARQYVLDDALVLTPSVALTAGYSSLGGSGPFGSVGAGLTLSNGGHWSLDAALRFNIEGDGQSSAGGRVGVAVRF
ncbi:cadherin-like beta sandwich domain-containing protein [Stappia sp. TSB10GB4]|uniref:cadherin-like beta sandwich domain-containing protein n=1 Tax=Stappia sp. TSB10GB4 TaxID=2003584 RepID=UPI001648BE0B|nr:cadherin-like beta sandwich domain-containing protein [Stappia sp. TSB10GB4]